MFYINWQDWNLHDPLLTSLLIDRNIQQPKKNLDLHEIIMMIWDSNSYIRIIDNNYFLHHRKHFIVWISFMKWNMWKEFSFFFWRGEVRKMIQSCQILMANLRVLNQKKNTLHWVYLPNFKIIRQKKIFQYFTSKILTHLNQNSSILFMHN